MKTDRITIGNLEAEVCAVNTVVVGTGAAGYKAAVTLARLGADAVMVTEGINMGTSRNTGSDKQTYYKLTLCGDAPDSPRMMARDLFRGGCMDGDIAMAEAALSAGCFLSLESMGVPFPTNRYGEFVGYKTDHDDRIRATSAGPLTSKLMTEALEKQAADIGVKIYDGYQVIEILTDGDSVAGLICLNKNSADQNDLYKVFRCDNVVYATGGPAGMYKNSVYPECHSGASGIAFLAGAAGKNLTEWQYGLASVNPRWNVSGTYMQVLPRLVSVDNDGSEHEFLSEYFGNVSKSLSTLFKKGYEWPFDTSKILGGSSIIDLLVYRETALRRRKVYLDFTKNHDNTAEIDFALLDREALDYLKNAGACFGNPYERLMLMNAPAIELYLSKGIDLKTEYLQIELSAQHNNGGLDMDLWWQSNIRGFFPVGEAAGTHGVYRPGGSALNSGQAGATRAAQYIAANPNNSGRDHTSLIQDRVRVHIDLYKTAKDGRSNAAEYLDDLQKEMSDSGGAIRNLSEIARAIDRRKKLADDFADLIKITDHSQLSLFYRLKDIVICQIVYLSAMKNYLEQGGGSRGSALYTDSSGILPEGMEEIFRFTRADGDMQALVQEVVYKDGHCLFNWRKTRPLPEQDDFFENVWRKFRENGNVY
ncbi:MAG: FAD-binding protein [Oscillospiraceae bacterium]|nr:FAD-binding protein [Oscillospiraceae bacterium]